MTRFAGTVALVAGGGRGIGARTATMLADEGARVVVGDVDESLGRELAERLGADRAVFQRLDVTDPAACTAAVERAVAEFGRLDYLVNSAIRMAAGPLVELALADWRLVIDVGLTGTFLMCQAAGRWMIGAGRPGAIVNLSSNAGLAPYPMAGAYSSVKAGVIMLSQQLALEWARAGIRVNVVCPGHTETPLTAYLKDPEIRRARSEVTPLGRVGQPDDVAHAVLYLLSDAAAWVTGTRLDVDGGVTRSIFNHMPGRRWK